MRPRFRVSVVGIRIGVPVEESALKRSRARERENRICGRARRVVEFEIADFCAGVGVIDLIPAERLPVQIEQTAADAERECVRAADLPFAHEHDFRDARAEPYRFRRITAFAVEPHFAEVERIQIFIKPLHAAADIERNFMISGALNDEIALADLAPFRSRGAGKIRRERCARIDEKSRAVEIRRSLDAGAEQEISRIHGNGTRAEIDILREANFLRSRAGVVPNDPARGDERASVGDSVKRPRFALAGKRARAPRNDIAGFFERNAVAVERRHLVLPRRGIDASLQIRAVAHVRVSMRHGADVFETAGRFVVSIDGASAVAAFRRNGERERAVAVKIRFVGNVPVLHGNTTGSKNDQPAERFAAGGNRRNAAARFRNVGHSRAEAIERQFLAQRGIDETRARDRVVSRFRDEFAEAHQLLILVMLRVARRFVGRNFVARLREKFHGGLVRIRGTDVLRRGEKLRADEPRAAVAFRSRNEIGVAAQIRHQGNRSAERAVRAIDGDIFRSRRKCAGVGGKIKIERFRIIVANRSRGKLVRGNGKHGGRNSRRKHQRTTRQRGTGRRLHRAKKRSHFRPRHRSRARIFYRQSSKKGVPAGQSPLKARTKKIRADLRGFAGKKTSVSRYFLRFFSISGYQTASRADAPRERARSHASCKIFPRTQSGARRRSSKSA